MAANISRVYKFGTVPSRVHPVAGEDAAIHQLWLANRLWNTLVAIERVRFDRYRRIMLDDIQGKIEECASEIGRLRGEIKMRRSAARTRNVDTAEIAESIRRLNEEKKSLVAQRKKNYPRLKAERSHLLKALADRTKYRRKLARQAGSSMGLFWGTSNDIIQRAETGSKGGGRIKFKRFSREGTLTCQIQNGMSIAAAYECKNNRLRIYKLDGYRYCILKIWVASVMERGKRNRALWLELPVVLHREIPPEAIIKSVSATKRDGRWTVNFTVNLPAPESKNGSAAIGIDKGWHANEDGNGRVGFYADSDGCIGEITTSASINSRLDKVEDLRSICDKMREDFLPDLAAALSELMPASGLDIGDRDKRLATEWSTRTSHIQQWRSTDRLAALIRWWSDNRLPGDESIFRRAVAWRKQYMHLSNWWRAQSRRTHGAKREEYRKFAALAAKHYDILAIEKFKTTKLIKNQPPESGFIGTPGGGMRQRLAPSLLFGALKSAFAREGGRIIEVNPAGTTKTCHLCGHREAWEDTQARTHVCGGCGITWDRDHNAAMNILARGMAASGETVRAENKGVAEKKWERARRRSQKPPETDSIDMFMVSAVETPARGLGT